MTGQLDARRALRATGLLRQFNELGVLHTADVHVAAGLGEVCGETDERVQLAAALAVRGTRQGSVVLRLADVPGHVTADDAEDEDAAPSVALPWPELGPWQHVVERSPMVATSDADRGRPLRLHHGGLWLDRYWRQEQAVADALVARAGTPVRVDPDRLRAALQRLWPGEEPDDQRRAAAVCLLSRVAVLGGGPGTGKTTTVARLLAALREAALPGRPPRVALAAPTGKAAARLQEAVQAAAAPPASDRPSVLSDDDRAFLAALHAGTLHRLLGARRGSSRFWHGAGNRLPHDVVVVDEASMVSLTLFARLLEALRPSARLVLVGDPDQLASVEAGAVLKDLVDPARGGARTAGLRAALAQVLPHDGVGETASDTPAARVRDGVALLTTVHRYDAGGAIDELAQALRDGDSGSVLAVLRRGDPAVRFDQVADDARVAGSALQQVREQALAQAVALVAAGRAGDAEAAVEALEAYRLLCAHRRGPRGVSHWAAQVQGWVVDELGVTPRRDGRYPGLPLIVTSNDPDNRLWNGDTGVVLDRDGALVVAFARGGTPYEVPLGRLADVRPLHAMTVHRSQGSQFADVTVLLPPASSPLGTRETLYTAVTRAVGQVHVVGSAQAVVAATERPVRRASGLRERLA